MPDYLISSDEARENLLACAVFLAERIRSADGHADAVKTIVPFYLQKSDVDTAAALADTISDPFTRDRLLIDVVEQCAAVDDDEYALQLVEAIEDHGLQAEAKERIAIQKSSKGDFEKAFELASGLEHPDNVYAAIAAAAADRGDEAVTAEALRAIEFPFAKAGALQTVAQIERQKGDAARTLAALERAFEAAGDIDYPAEQIRALCDLANHFTDARRADRAIEIFDRAKTLAEQFDDKHREAFLSAVAAGFFRAGSIDLADRTLDLIRDKTQIASTLLGFARAYRERGETADAVETLDEAHAILKSQHEKETRDSPAKFKTHASVAAEYARLDRGERAIETAQEIADENEQMTSLAQIAAIAAGGGKDETVAQAVAAIRDELQKCSALVGASDAKERAGERDAAHRFLDEAAHQAGLIPQFSARSSALNEIARRYADFGEPEKSRAMTHESLETIAGIRDESRRAVALAALAEIFAEKGFEMTDAESEVLAHMVRKAEM